MSTSHFSVTEHTIPCQYIREYPHATKSSNASLRLAIKEYQPLGHVPAGSVTIIAAHGNGFPKETYEPLFDDLYSACGGRISRIWFADCAHQGASGVLNENVLGDDPNWFDHSRDLLCMVNYFRDRMPEPIIGVAHSFGAAQMVYLSLMHPRLFHSLALIEPVIQLDGPAGPNTALFSTLRPDVWPSRIVAEDSLRKTKVFRNWDARAFDQYVRYGLRDLPTSSPLTATMTDVPVTLTTSKHQEAWTYARSNFISVIDPQHARLLAPDLSVENSTYLFHRPEMVLTFNSLPRVRPNILWLFGARSSINTPTSRINKLECTGTDVGGSGGVKAGKVKSVTIAKGTHMLPFECIQETASLLAAWLKEEMQDFEQVQNFLLSHDSGRSQQEMKVFSKLWIENVKLKADEKRIDKSKL